jgi:hypothetical protein
MLTRTVLIATAVLAFVATGAGAPGTQLPGQPQFLAGWVHMSTSPNGLATVVTVTSRQSTADGSEAVESAFRLQHAKPQHLEYEGLADIVYEAKRLTVLAGGGMGWQFLVADGLPEALGPSRYPTFAVIGLSRHWGAPIQRSASEVSSSLLAEVCSVGGMNGDSQGGCDSCTWGGKGTSNCESHCEAGEDCSAICAPGYHACCSCPSKCTCCADQIETPAAPVPR